MKFALDTYRDIAHGNRDERIHAFFTMAIWFASGGYIFSSLGEYILLFEDDIASIFGAAFVAALVSIIKIS